MGNQPTECQVNQPNVMGLWVGHQIQDQVVDRGVAPMVFPVGEISPLEDLNAECAVLREKNALFPPHKEIGVDLPNLQGE